jgi:hypothetical protein
MSHIKDRLKEIFENTIESGIIYDGSVDKPDYYNLFCKAAANDQLYKMMGNNLCMFNCQVNGDDTVMMLFSIPINSSEEAGTKNVAERVMEVVENIENCFITIDDIKTEPVQEDKFIYITALKTI